MNQTKNNIDRRTAVKLVSSIMGISIIGAQLFISGCKDEKKPASGHPLFSEALLDEIGEIILPETDQSPGGKAAQVGKFINHTVHNCYSKKEQDILINGVKRIDEIAIEKYVNNFLELDGKKRFELIAMLDVEAQKNEEAGHLHFFTMLKQLVILGYFTSEIGVTKALRYNPLPGGYRGCEPYQKGQPAWYGPLSSLG